jgi:hypothetical protein
MGILKFKFSKIVVFKGYEVENGILGFKRDVYYLSIAEFLDSSNETHSI